MPRDRAGPRRDLGDLEAPARADVVLPEMLEELLVGLGLFGDALDHDGRSLLRLGERKRLDPGRLRHPRYRVAVRAGARHSQKLGQTVLDPGRERMLEPMRLLGRRVQPEGVRQPALEETVTASHDLGDLPALPGEHELLLAPRELHVAAAGHAMNRLSHGGRGDAHVLGEPRADHRLAAARQVVDRREIILDRGRRGSGLRR